MGMFDTVRCFYPLTDQPKLNATLAMLTFQTKSRACRLDWYEICEDGSLWYETDIDGQHEGDFNKSTFTGTINMVASNSRHQHGFYEFNVSFVDGCVTDVERILPID